MKPWLKKSLKISLVLTLLFAGAWLFENWRGRRALEKAEQRAADAGISLDPARYQPAPVPDEENLLKNDLFFEEWKGDVEPRVQSWDKMNFLGTREPVRRYGINQLRGRSLDFSEFSDGHFSEEEIVNKLTEASGEVQVRLDQLSEIILSYPGQPLFQYLPTEAEPFPRTVNMSALRDLTECFRDLAILNLRNDNAPSALRNIQVIGRLAECFGGPSVFHHQWANSLRGIQRQIIWEGLRLQSWNEGQLTELPGATDLYESSDSLEQALKLKMAVLQSLFTHPDVKASQVWFFFGEYFAMESGPTLKNRVRDLYLLGGPSGWKAQRKAIVIDGFIDHLENRSRWSTRYLEKTKSPNVISPWNPFLLGYAGPAEFRHLIEMELDAHTRMRVARLAILLELHFLKHGSYPDSIDDLAGRPKLLDANDPDERPLAFDLDSQGRPQIWSVREVKENRQRLRWRYHEDSPPGKWKKTPVVK